MKKKNFTKRFTALIFIFIPIFLLSNSAMAIVHPYEIGQQFVFPQDFAPQSYQNYQIRPGDSLYSIAQKFSVNLTELRQVNNLWTNKIRIGQSLKIPVSNTDHVIYRVQEGDNLTKISTTFNVAVKDIKEANNLLTDHIKVGQELTIPQAMNPQRTYTVQKEDTLYSIAARFDISITDLSNENDLSLGYIWPGQVLNIPDSNRSFNPQKETIIVDAGHGGSDPGAVTHFNSKLIKESDIVLDISKRLVSLLKEDGYNVIETRTGDYGLTLWQRVQSAYKHNADLFLSIHTDNNPNFPWTGGSNIYIQPGANWNTYQLANSVQENMEKTTGRITNSLGRVLKRPFTVVMQSRPAILIETGFLSNRHDITGFQTTKFRQSIARGIFNGVTQWLN